jgi:hypothetical protein
MKEVLRRLQSTFDALAVNPKGLGVNTQFAKPYPGNYHASHTTIPKSTYHRGCKDVRASNKSATVPKYVAKVKIDKR